MATLEVRNLQTSFFTKAGEVKAVDDVSFTVDRGQVLGLVGESGSGKTVTGFSIMGLVDAPGRVVGGQIQFQGEDLVGVSLKRWQKLRGNQIAMVFQDPMMTLNPVLTIGTQMVEAILKDKKKILPCAVFLEGEYGIRDLFVGVPVKLGAGGAEQIIEVRLEADEQAALDRSAASVKELVSALGL